MEQNFVQRYFDDWTGFEKVWLFVFVGLNLAVFTLTDGGSALGLLASVTGIITVVLVARGDITNYAFGVINVLLYGYLALQANFLGEVMLNWGYYLPMQFIGYYLWTKNMNDGLVEVKNFTTTQRLGIYAGAVVAIGGYGLILQALNGNLPFFDATSTVLSVIAMLLMAARSKDQWGMWVIVNVVSIYMWTDQYLRTGTGLSVLLMWVAYLVNSVYGYYNWSKMGEN